MASLPIAYAVVLPPWVYDVLRDLIDHEDHPKLLFTSGGFEGTAQYDWCPCNALAKVPSEVIAHARVLNDYLRASQTVETTSTSTN